MVWNSRALTTTPNISCLSYLLERTVREGLCIRITLIAKQPSRRCKDWIGSQFRCGSQWVAGFERWITKCDILKTAATASLVPAAFIFYLAHSNIDYSPCSITKSDIRMSCLYLLVTQQVRPLDFQVIRVNVTTINQLNGLSRGLIIGIVC